MKNKDLIIVTPVYNDWESFQVLVDELYGVTQVNDFQITQIVAINDGSERALDATQFVCNIPVTVLNLNNNMGHQRAIAIGLSYIEAHLTNEDKIIVMDCDGEDQPSDIIKLIGKKNKNQIDSIVFAKRQKRTEGLLFKFFYKLYKITFYALTRQKLDFGNFSCIPKDLLVRVVAIPELWNHYSGAIIKSKISYTSVNTDRGKRFQGESKMNFQNLVLHGLSSISIYLDVVSIRLLFISFFAMIITVIGILLVIGLTLFTELTIPGWPSVVALSLLNILAVVLLTTFLILLFQLNQKNTIKLSPKNFYKDFIFSIKKF